MTGGYIGKLLFIDLSSGKVNEEVPDESLYRDFIGGYGIGARILYSRQKGKIDPLGPENTLGLLTGPLTGTPAVMGCRYVAVAKSPLTNSWGDANSGGSFGPYLKFAGYDGILFSGISEKPVYLILDNGKAELRDAGHIWGKGTYETEGTLKTDHGTEARVVSIGPAGEKLSKIACIMSDNDAAGRSGLGAVMGSKKLKAVVVKGNKEVPIADINAANQLRKEHVSEAKEFFTRFRIYGTGGHGDISAQNGDTPVKNWGGIGIIDVPDVSGLHGDHVIANLDKRKGCWHCPATCKAILKEGTGEYKYPAGIARLEYETIGAFGANCCNTNVESIEMANYYCNNYGVDTISAGSTIAFAMECYENGIISRTETDGIDLRWGNHRALVDMLEKMVKREGFGDILADGVKFAAEKISRGAREFAVHIGGQELGMHDPREINRPRHVGIASAGRYKMDATPGRHTAGFGPVDFYAYALNASGLCLHSTIVGNLEKYLTGYMSAITGYDRSYEEILICGERIENIRHVFTLREGVNPLERFVHPRIIGQPPQEVGPLAGLSPDIEAEQYWNLGALDWDRFTTKPSKKKLLELGLDDLADDLWPSETKST